MGFKVQVHFMDKRICHFTVYMRVGVLPNSGYYWLCLQDTMPFIQHCQDFLFIMYTLFLPSGNAPQCEDRRSQVIGNHAHK